MLQGLLPGRNIDAFSQHAQDRLSAHVKKFSGDLADEAERLEAVRRAPKAQPEVTGSMVDDAAKKLRGALFQQPKSIWPKIRGLTATVSALILGIVFDPNGFTDATYLLVFLLFAAFAVVVITAHAILD